jgi:cyclophilin family peptidyl-prolyl cis-trans isomerase
VTRVVPLLVLVALLVVGGIIASRDQAAAETQASVESELPTAEPAAPEPADAAAEPAAEPESPAATDAEAAPDVDPEPTAHDEDQARAALVPEGYVQVAPLTGERRTAFEAAEQVLDPALDYAAVIETNRGVMVIDLYQDQTPVTVNNFVFLALHRYFDGIVFHRVLEDFMAQTGDPTGTGTGGPGYRFGDEIVPGLGHDARGVVSMANAGPGTNGSQFFITFTATPWLDGNHTVFGRVTQGDEVLDALTRIDPASPNPAAAALLDAPASDLRQQGLPLEGEGTVLEALEATLGAEPVVGQPFEVAGYRGVIGTMQGLPAAGFFPFPDAMERVIIVARER